MPSQTCKHDGCDCRAESDRQYCSTWCEKNGNVKASCQCGHPGCSGAD